jgi:hypothetical protein
MFENRHCISQPHGYLLQQAFASRPYCVDFNDPPAEVELLAHVLANNGVCCIL